MTKKDIHGIRVYVNPTFVTAVYYYADATWCKKDSSTVALLDNISRVCVSGNDDLYFEGDVLGDLGYE